MARSHPMRADGTVARRAAGDRLVACAILLAGAAGLAGSLVLGVPIVSILVVGVLLLCPLLTWVPFRNERRAGPPTAEEVETMPEVVVLASAACHLCEDAVATLEELSREFPLTVRQVDMDSVEGAWLVGLHRPAMPPAVLLDGELFSCGRLPRKKLRRYLQGKERVA